MTDMEPEPVRIKRYDTNVNGSRVNVMEAWKRGMAVASFAAVSTMGHTQVPDLMNTLDAGGRAMGMGGGTYAVDSGPLSGLHNPAGLAYVDRPTVSVALRNLPSSRTRVAGDLSSNPSLDTTARDGFRAVTHAGLAFPFQGGALGISYTAAGFIRDESEGFNLTKNAVPVRSFFELLTAKTDLFTVSYGTGDTGNGLTYGVGLVFANQYVRNVRSIVYTDTNITPDETDFSGNATGVGVVAGMNLLMDRVGRTSLGFSVRSPIDLQGGDISDYFDRVPGKASLSFAGRMDALRGGNDFLLYGVQVNHFFGGQGDRIIPRSSQTVVGGGLEYNLHRWNMRIPIRLGYTYVPDGGLGFDQRSAFTFGIGYRPLDGRFALDLNFAAPEGGRYDMALSMTYKLGN